LIAIILDSALAKPARCISVAALSVPYSRLSRTVAGKTEQ